MGITIERKRKKEGRRFFHRDYIRNIEAIEERDIIPLVRLGKAWLERSSDNEPALFLRNPSLCIRSYIVLLRTNLDFAFIHVKVKFVYDERTRFGEIQIPKISAMLLEQAFNNQSNGSMSLVEAPQNMKCGKVCV